MYMREVRSRKLKEKKNKKKTKKTKQKKQNKKTRKRKKNKKNYTKTKQKLGHSRFNSFFKVIESRKSFGGVKEERVPEAGGRRDK